MDPVIIVGAGPVGLALALDLSHRRVPVIVLDAGDGRDERRLSRTALLRPDTAGFVERLGCSPAPHEAVRWTAWRTLRRRQLVNRTEFADPAGERTENAETSGTSPAGPDRIRPGGVSPLHLPQHVLTRRLREALAAEPLAQLVTDSRVDELESDADGVAVHTRGANATWWRGSYVIGCDGARSAVRKLLDVRFPGRTAVERHAVAAVRVDLPWPGEAVLHRSPPRGGEVSARPLPDGVWRLDWLLAPRGELVTPEALVTRIRDTLGGWNGTSGDVPPYELLDTGVHTIHHRLARRWRVGRVFLAGDAAHLLGALGTQGLDEGLRDAANLAWKLARAWHHGDGPGLLDSYQAERRGAVSARLRAADQFLPLVRARGGWAAVRRALPGASRVQDAALTDGHLGEGTLGSAPVYALSPLAPPAPAGSTHVATPVGAPVSDVVVTAPDGSPVRLHDRLGGDLLVVLVAPGTGVWDRRHWLTAGLMPRLAAAVAALPMTAELLVTESYPGAAAHTVLLVRPDGHLVAAMAGVRPAELYACADAVRGGVRALEQNGGTADAKTRSRH